jgi:hypothetical protein
MVSNFKNLAFTQPLVGQGGPLILDRHLQPVWFDPVPTDVYSLNLRAQALGGKPVLSWWEGIISNTGAVLSGEDFVVNQQYRQVATLVGADGWTLSPHEFLISGSDAWVTAYKNEPMNLAAYGGPTNGILTDSAVQEYDLRSGKLLYSWDAAAPGHIPLSESETSPAPATPATPNGIPWDPYHVNSISLMDKGAFVASMRNTWAAYMVDIRTGGIEWTLGGKSSSFAFGPGAAFEWQHDVEFHGASEISLFDDACCAVIGPGRFAPANGPSRGLVLKLDSATHSATFVAQYSAGHPGLDTSTQGNTQLLPDGNAVVGWGGQPWFSEYSASGKLLLDARFPTPDISYRAYVQPWVGTPYFPPRGAARKTKHGSTVYASWDGATRVVAWTVLAGPNATHLASVATAAKTGFETAIRLARSYKIFKVQALDSRGDVLRTSKAFRVPKPGLPTPPPTGFY